MRAFVIGALLMVCSCAHVNTQLAFDANSQRGVLLYESTPNTDFIIQRVDMQLRRSVGEPIMLPATHRINAVTIRREASTFSADEWSAYVQDAELEGTTSPYDLALGFKELDPGYYALVDAYTSATVVLGGDRLSGGCRDDDAIVFEVRRGEVGVLPRSYYRIVDLAGRTGVGREPLALAKARAVVTAYPNIRAPIALLQVVYRITYHPRTSRDFLRESCASGIYFELTPPDHE